MSARAAGTTAHAAQHQHPEADEEQERQTIRDEYGTPIGALVVLDRYNSFLFLGEHLVEPGHFWLENLKFANIHDIVGLIGAQQCFLDRLDTLMLLAAEQRIRNNIDIGFLVVNDHQTLDMAFPGPSFEIGPGSSFGRPRETSYLQGEYAKADEDVNPHEIESGHTLSAFLIALVIVAPFIFLFHFLLY